MTLPIVGTGLRFALAFGAPPAAATGFAPASAHNHSFRGEKSQTAQKIEMSLENKLARHSRTHRRESTEVVAPSREHRSFARGLSQNPA
jgi:hypothetical protein